MARPLIRANPPEAAPTITSPFPVAAIEVITAAGNPSFDV